MKSAILAMKFRICFAFGKVTRAPAVQVSGVFSHPLVTKFVTSGSNCWSNRPLVQVEYQWHTHPYIPITDGLILFLQLRTSDSLPLTLHHLESLFIVMGLNSQPGKTKKAKAYACLATDKTK